MQVDAIEARDGARWFVAAGLVALVLSVTLYFADEMLSNSSRDSDLGATLRELRTAQTSVGSVEYTDPRQSANPSSR